MAKIPRPRWNEIIPTIDKGSDEQAVGEANIVAPFTTIQNRAKVEANCKVVGASERIRINSLRLLPNEFGPNGEPVYTSDKEDSRIRFIGGNWETLYDNSGTRILKVNTGVTTTVVEVTYYGTGLNLMAAYNGTGFTFDEQTDNGAINNIVSSFNPSLALGGRKTNLNNIQPITSNLPLEWHTTKIIYDIGTHALYGFEILNESSNLTVLSGSIFKRGYEYKLENNTTLPMIPTAYSGTNGGRVLTYIDENFEVQQAVNEVGTPAYLASADHSNEAIYRKVNWREFGREISNDFSTLTTTFSDRAFTLDDGTTTLVGNDVRQGSSNSSAFGFSTASSFVTLTFVGTGLDITGTTDDGLEFGNVIVDGVTVGTISREGGEDGVTKICSDLPYGTHTVKIDNSIYAAAQEWLKDFIIYRPKKPTVAQELPILADYNIMADYVEDSTVSATGGSGIISQGVVRKCNTREVVYEGTWSISAVQIGDTCGFPAVSTTGTPSFQFSFFGTGFDLWSRSGSGATTSLIEIDKHDGLGFQTFNDTNFPSVASGATYSGAGGSFNSATGEMIASVDFNSRLTGVENLVLDFYTVKVTCTANVANTFELQAVDIITPIHSPNLMIGSLGVGDKRQTLSDIKTNVNVDIPDSEVKVSNNIAQVLQSTVSTGVVHIYYEEVFIDENIDISSVSTFAGNRVIGVDGGILRSHQVNISNHIASTGARENGSCSVQLDGKKQKDVFKD